MKRRSLNILVLTLILAAHGFAQDLESFEKRVAVKTLPNGLTLLVLERPEAPVFSFFTSMYQRTCGLVHCTRVSTPEMVFGEFLSNSAWLA